jgi:transposase
MTKLYLGIDFHKNTSTLCVVDHEGKKLELNTIATAKLVPFLSNRKFEVIGIEASGGTNHAVQKLKDSGHNVRIINSNRFKAVGIGGKKTDDRDAEAIAHVLRTNYAPEVFHKSERSRNLKSLLVSREQLVRARVNLVNHIRGTLREYGISMPAGMDKFLEHVSASLRLLLNPYIRDILTGMLSQIETLMIQEKMAEAGLEEMTEDDKRVAKLRTVPGIGNLGSIAIAAVIDDISRFKDAKHFASYIGLVPQEHSSGGKRMLGSITRSGSEIVRRYLIHGARALLLHTKEDCKDYNRLWAMKLKDKAGMNKATVAMAHKLARIAFSVLKNDREYTVERPKRVA